MHMQVMFQFCMKIYLASIIIGPLTAGYSNGAPRSTCIDLLFHHEGSSKIFQFVQMVYGLEMEEQDDGSYLITITKREKTDYIPQNGVYTVFNFILNEETLDSIFVWRDTPFKGFILQVRNLYEPILPPAPLGHFATNSPPYSQVFSCWYPGDTLTHAGIKERYIFKAIWHPHPEFNGQVYAIASVVETMFTGYYDLKSATVLIKARTTIRTNSSTQTSPITEEEKITTTELTTSTKFEFGTTLIATTTVLIPRDLTTDCEYDVNCFGYPVNCTASNTCKVLLKWIAKKDFIVIDLIGSSPKGKYIAASLSQDRRMGDDLAIVCAQTSNASVMETLWMNSFTASESYRYLQLDEVNYLNVQYEDDILRCQTKIDITGKIFISRLHVVDFSRPYYFLLASGLYNEKVTYHFADKELTKESFLFLPPVLESSGNIISGSYLIVLMASLISLNVLNYVDSAFIITYMYTTF